MAKRKPIVFASQSRVAAVEPWAPRFFREVLHRNYLNCWISDSSDIRELLQNQDSLEAVLDRIRHHYFLEPPAGETSVVALLEFLRDEGIEGSGS